MSYIDRLKRAAIPLGAIVALSASAVLAQDRLTKDDLATLAATLGVYDGRCETLPPGLRADLQRKSDCSIKTTCWLAASTNRRKSTEPAKRSGVTRTVG